LGEEFRDEACETFRRIKEFPLAWHPLGGAIRRCQMQRFPYGIIYEPSEVEIVLIAVAHLHREPGVLAVTGAMKDAMFRNGMRPVHPGEILREDYLVPLGMMVTALVKALNIPSQRVNDIVRERRAVTADTAMRLARYFGADALSRWLA